MKHFYAITILLISIALLSCEPKKQIIQNLTSETILYGLNGTIWEYDVSTAQSAVVVSLNGEEDSPVYDKMKINIIYDTFMPASPTRATNLYSIDYPDRLNNSHFSGADYVSVEEPSFCIGTDKVVAIKRELDAKNPKIVLTTHLVEIDMSGTETNDFGAITIDAYALNCSNIGDKILYTDYDRITGLSSISMYDVTLGVTDTLTSPSLNCDAQDWSPDSQWIYATCAGSLYKMRSHLDPATNLAAEMAIINVPSQKDIKFFGPVLSPMGTKIALEQYNSNSDGIYILDINTGALTNINIAFGARLTDWR